MNKRYLGDSVYVELNEAQQLVLTTENGDGPSNTIFLEPEVYVALTQYATAVSEAARTTLLKRPDDAP